MATILQSSLLTDFLYPFLLVFFILFAVLEKTNIFGSNKKQLNASVSLIVGLIFVGAVFPKMVAENMVVFMTVGLVIIFVGLVLWGFITGQTPTPGDKWKKFYAILLGIAIVTAVIWATGFGAGVLGAIAAIFSFLFDSSWSGTFWTNVLFVGLIAIAIAVVLKSKGAAEGKDKP
jgi:hypothetical protein